MMGMWESRAVVCVYVCVHHGHTCWQRQQCPRWCVSHCHSGSFESWTQTFPPGAPSFDCLSHCHCDGRVSSRRRGGREYLEWSGVERWGLEHNSPKSFFLSFIVVRLLARLLRVVREFLCCFNLTLKSGLNFRIGGQPPETERPNKKKKSKEEDTVEWSRTSSEKREGHRKRGRPDLQMRQLIQQELQVLRLGEVPARVQAQGAERRQRGL